MCARLLACPLCSQPGFLTLDALRTGLVSVATRPLVCPVCNEVLLGIDKLTIHLFGHTINQNNTNVTQESKILEVNSGNNVQIIHNLQTIPFQTWNLLKTQNIKTSQVTEVPEKISFIRPEQESYPVKENEILLNPQIPREDQNHEPKQSRVIFFQNVSSDQIYSANVRQNGNGDRNSSRLDSNCSFRRIQDNSTQETQERQIKTLKSNLVQNNTSLHQNNLTFIQNDSNLIQNNSNIIQNNSNLIQNNSNLIQNNSNMIQNNSTLIQNNPTLIHQNEKYVSSLQIGTTQSSWIPNNSSVIIDPGGLIVRENSGNLDGTQITNLLINTNNEKRRDSTQVESCGLTNSEIENEFQNQEKTESELKNSQENETVESVKKSQDVILPHLKAFRLLASKEKMERCNICGYRFDDRKILILHKQLVHMIAEKDLNVRPEDLLKNYPCHLCTKVFKMRGSLMVHMRVAHTGFNLGSLTMDSELLSPNNENGYNCPTCGKNFKKEQHVTQHLKTHEGKQWECDVCSKMFTTKYFLKKHKRLHSGEMPYKCSICDKTFTFQQSYHKHRLYHKDDKPHTCNTCGRSFKELSTLHNHERIHTGEKPFACETCGKCFRQRVSYLVHRRIHTGVMPYKCTVCSKSFRYKVSQRTHKCQAPAPAPETSTQNSENIIQRLLQISESEENKNETFQVQNQQIDTECSEGNKFILVVNTEGQHILTRESDVKNSEAVENSSNLESTRVENPKNEGENIWTQETNNTSYKESMDVSTKEQTNNEKLHLEDPHDFFSMVMSPLENDLSTPSTEMEHLRLSSPVQIEDRNKPMNNFSQDSDRLEIIGMVNSEIEKRFEENHIRGSLRTIDDESLNELIYGINRG